jgi:hypothetical protein
MIRQGQQGVAVAVLDQPRDRRFTADRTRRGRARKGGVMRSPRGIFLTLLVITVVCFALAGMIGQHNDGPWGDLPEWLGSVSWFGFLIGLLGVIVSGIYLLVRTMGRRSATD